jgi:hypothetical protein
MTREQRQAHFENLHWRIEQAIIEYEETTGEEVVDVSIMRGGDRVKVMIRPSPT